MLYAKNLQNFLDLVISKEGALSINWDDEIIKETVLARGGKIVHPLLRKEPVAAS
jgi:NAD(P) transhydrogenase subunit alpha